MNKLQKLSTMMVLGLVMSPLAVTAQTVTTDVNQINWQPAQSKVYQFSQSTEVLGHQSSSQKTSATLTQISGLLNMRVYNVEAQQIIAGFQISKLAISVAGQRNQDLEQLYKTPFLVTFNHDGLPQQFNFPKVLPPQSRQALGDIVKGFQWVMPKRVTKDNQWTVKESNATGSYSAQYKYEPQQQTYVKQRQHYKVISDNPMLANTMEVKTKTSKFTAILAKNSSWLERFSGEETLDVYLQRQLFVQSRFKSELTTSTEAMSSELFLSQFDSASSLKSVLFDDDNSQWAINVKTIWQKMEQAQFEQQYANISLSQLLQSAHSAAAKPQSMRFLNAMNQIEQYIKVFPQSSAQLPDLLMSMNLPPVIYLKVIAYLGNFGQSAHQQALVAIMNDVRLTDAVNREAVRSASRVTNAQSELVTSLEVLIERSRDSLYDQSMGPLAAATLRNLNGM